MDALITGATGFIGSRLAEQLAHRGHRVVAFGAQNSPLEAARRSALEAQGIPVEIGTLDDTELLRRLADNAETVFHLAAAQHESHVSPQYFHAVNVAGTRNMLDACAKAGVRRFIYGSSIGVYGSARSGRLDERSATHPENPYGVTKLEAERAVTEGEGRVPWTVIRISETYGPGDGRLAKLFRLVDRSVVPIIGGGRNEHQPVYVDDLIDALERAAMAADAVGETFVIAGRDVMQTVDLIATVAAALDKPLRSVRLPLAPCFAAALLCETGCRALGVAPPWHRRRLDFYVKRFVFSIEKAERVLGYLPRVSFAEGARETAQWYRTNGYL